MSKPVILVENLSKRYRIGGPSGYTSYGSLRETLAEAASAPLRRLRGQPPPERREIWALKDVSFEVQRGEVLGIIGRNGAGKSTLLKILSRITKPTEGRVTLRGRVGSLLEVGTGFHPELTGRENIFLNGAILGMTRREIEGRFAEIVDFAEIEQFLDTPVKYYSSGMYMRLAFAVAAHLEPEILLVDEVLAVGDTAFQKKCLGKMGQVASEGRTVLFVSHNLSAVKSLCQNGLLIDQGIIKSNGLVQDCIEIYLFDEKAGKTSEILFDKKDDLDIQLHSIRVTNRGNQLVDHHPFDQPLFICIELDVHKQVNKHYLALHIHDSDHNTIIFTRDFESDRNNLLERMPGRQAYIVEIPPNILVPGRYRISIHLAKSLPPQMVDQVDFVCPFEVFDSSSIRAELGFPWYGKIGLPLKWKKVRNKM